MTQLEPVKRERKNRMKKEKEKKNTNHPNQKTLWQFKPFEAEEKLRK